MPFNVEYDKWYKNDMLENIFFSDLEQFEAFLRLFIFFSQQVFCQLVLLYPS